MAALLVVAGPIPFWTGHSTTIPFPHLGELSTLSLARFASITTTILCVVLEEAGMVIALDVGVVLVTLAGR